MKIYIPIICFLLPVFTVLGQQKEESQLLFNNLSGKARIDSIAHSLLNKNTTSEQKIIFGKKAFKLSNEINYSSGKIEALYSIAKGFYEKNKYDSALTYYNQSYELAKINNNQLWVLKNKIEFGEIDQVLFKTESAIDHYNSALNDAILQKDSVTIGILYNYLGFVYWRSSDFLNAIKYYKLAINITKKTNRFKDTYAAYNSIGASYSNLSNANIALEYYFNAFEYAKKYFKGKKPLILCNIGTLYLELNDIDLAEKYFNDALKLVDLNKISLESSYMYLCLAELNSKKNDYYKAIEYYNISRKYYGTGEIDYSGMAKISNRLGETYLELKKFDLAKTHVLEAYEISKKYNLKNHLVTSLINFSKIYLKMGNINEAQKNVDKAFLFSQDGNFLDALTETSKLQYEIYKKTKNYKKSLQFYEQYIALQDSLANKKNLRTLTETKENFETTQKEKRNNELQNINKLQTLELKRKRLQNILIICASVFFVFVIIYLLYINNYNKKKNKYLSTANDEIKRINEKLNNTNKLLEYSNSTKDKFFSIISHDLRNPFNTILGASRILNEELDELNKKEIKELIEIVTKDSERLYALLENLLSWANSQTGKLKANKVNIFLNNMVSEIVQLYISSAKSKNIELKIDIAKHIIVVFDEFMLNTILRNLISNAIKFSNSGSIINIIAEEQNNSILLIVKDTGVGIKEHNLKKIFDEGSNFNEPGTNNEKGTGLGLLLCHNFVKQNSSDISVESKYGEGTTFTITLQKSK